MEPVTGGVRRAQVYCILVSLGNTPFTHRTRVGTNNFLWHPDFILKGMKNSQFPLLYPIKMRVLALYSFPPLARTSTTLPRFVEATRK